MTSIKFMDFEGVRLVELPSPGNRYPDLFSGVAELDAELAERLLKFNNRNRDLSQRRVSELKRTMSAQQWMLNGDTIVFAADDGEPLMLDGQHRAESALQLADGDSYASIIVYGVESDAQITIDQGTRRAAHEQLAIAGVSADKSIAAAIKLLILWDESMLFQAPHEKRTQANTTDIVVWAQLHPEAMALLRDYGARGYRRIPGSKPAVGLVAAYRFGMIDRDLTAALFSGLISPVGLQEGSPILALRARLELISRTRERVTPRDLLGYFITTWNMLRDGRSAPGILNKPKGGTYTAASFPEPK